MQHINKKLPKTLNEFAMITKNVSLDEFKDMYPDIKWEDIKKNTIKRKVVLRCIK